MNRRPVGVILAAIVLSIAALFLLLAALLAVAGGFAMQHASALPSTPGVTPPPPGMMVAFMAVGVVVYLSLAGWAIATVAGLFRMRNWARISIMIIGGGLVAIGFFAALGTFASQALVGSTQMPPNSDPAVLRIVFIVMAVGWLIIAAIGVWWLVYFALRRTRAAFASAAAQHAGLSPYLGYGAQPPAAPLPRIDPRTDFAYAQPALGQQPSASSHPELYVPPQSPSYFSPQTAKRPVSMTVIGIFMLFGAVAALGEAFLPIPFFFFGAVITGWTAHITMLVWAVVSAYAGYGLIRLQKPAWFVTMGIFGVGVVNSLLLVIPAYRARMDAYTHMLAGKMLASFPSPLGTTTPGLDPHLQAMFSVVGYLIGMIFAVFLFVLLWRARWAFEPNALRPPAPQDVP